MAAATTPKKYAAIVQAIIDGKHDKNLDMIVQAAEWRKKKLASESGIRKGAKVKVANDPRRAANFAGREGIVVKVNKVRTTVAFACPTCGKYEASVNSGTVTGRLPSGAEVVEECKACWGFPDSAGIPTDLLTAVTS